MPSGGTISEGNGIPGSSNGIGMVSCAGVTGRPGSPAKELPASPPAGANSPPTPPGLPAGQRGCCEGSQSALSSPLTRNSCARAITSSADRAILQARADQVSQMQRRDLCVQKVAALDRPGDRPETSKLCIEFDRQAVALAKIAIEIGRRPRSPLFKAFSAVTQLQKRHCTDEHALFIARHPAPALIA